MHNVMSRYQCLKCNILYSVLYVDGTGGEHDNLNADWYG